MHGRSPSPYLARFQRIVRNLQNHVRPGEVQQQQRYQQTVEDEVGGEHGQNARRLHRAAVDDARIEAEPRDDPDEREHGKDAVAQLLVVGVLGDFGRLQEDVGAIVDDQHQRADAMQIAHPRQRQQDQRDDVVHEHLPEVLALDVEELGDDQRPVKGHGEHVVRPDVTVHRLEK